MQGVNETQTGTNPFTTMENHLLTTGLASGALLASESC